MQEALIGAEIHLEGLSQEFQRILDSRENGGVYTPEEELAFNLIKDKMIQCERGIEWLKLGEQIKGIT